VFPLYVPFVPTVNRSITLPVLLLPWNSETIPVAVPGATAPLTATLPPTVNDPVGGANVVVEPVRLGEAQAASKFATFTLPSPVAKSYPAAVPNAGVVPPVVVAMTPNWFAEVLVLLQFGLPPTHATETLPLVVS